MASLGNEALDNFYNFGMQERLSPGDGNHGRTTLIGSSKCLRRRDAFPQKMVRILHFSTTLAGKIASEERLEHEHERVTFLAT